MLAGEGVDAGEEALEPVEIGLPFDGEEEGLATGAAVITALGDAGGAMRGVHGLEKMKAGLFEEALVFTARGEEIEADGTADGQLFVGDHAGGHQGVAEEEAAAPGLRTRRNSRKTARRLGMWHMASLEAKRRGCGEKSLDANHKRVCGRPEEILGKWASGEARGIGGKAIRKS